MPEPLTSERWERAKEIFEAALEQPSERRSAFIVEACQGDSQLRAEVENLVLGDARADATFLNPPTMPGLFPGWPTTQPLFRDHQVISRRFEILRFIGRGGMGEVYEAKDLELGEGVALKAIRPELSSNPLMLKRFRHELQLARRVTHPNVCRLHHLESFTLPSGDSRDDGTAIAFITMELLEGETLAERLKRQGRMTESEAGPLVCQIADGLAAAHEAGVIHRDLKPGNIILVSTAGRTRAVITDFGLARPAEGILLLPGGDSTGSLSGSGRLIGTPQYMAPEQLQGGKITPATDIYALGLIMYEMVTGLRPFADHLLLADAFQRLKQSPPSPRVYFPDLDPTWESIILRCLEIDPARRFASALEVVARLEGDPVRTPRAPRVTRPIACDAEPHTSSKVRRAQPILRFSLGALAVAIAGVVLWVLWQGNRRAALFQRFVQITRDSGLTWCPSLSADGRLLAYSSDREGQGNLEIWVQYLSGGTAMRVTHSTADESEPALSPDGSKVVYRSEREDGGVYINSSYGGDERLLAKYGRSPRFSPDGTQVVYWTGDESNLFLPTGRVYVIATQGGTPQPIQPKFADGRYPIWAPDGQHILFLGSLDPQALPSASSDWWVAPLNGGQAVRTRALEAFRDNGLFLRGCPPSWIGDRIVFSARLADSTNLWQIPLSLTSWRINGGVERLTFGAAQESSPWLSQDGTLVFTKFETAANIYELPLNEPGSGTLNLRRLTADSALDINPDISADGNMLVFGERSQGSQSIRVQNLRTGAVTRLTASGVKRAVISRDGTRVAYSLTEGSKEPILVVPVNGGGAEKACEDCGEVLNWSPDDAGILYSFGQPVRVGAVNLQSGSRATLLQKADVSLDQAQISPDGRWIAFAYRVDSDHSKIMVAPVQGESAPLESQWEGLTDGLSWDDKPRWSEDGRTIFFYSNRDGFGCIWKINVQHSRDELAKPLALIHFHNSRTSYMYLTDDNLNLAVGGGELVLDIEEKRGNIWMAEAARNH